MGLCPFHRGLIKQTQSRVFFIGHGRTAARSVIAAIHLLGYSVRHGLGKCLPCIEDCLEKVVRHRHDLVFYETCEVAAEMPLVHWRQLAEAQPDAKFILTTRPIDSWVTSWEGKRKRADRRIRLAFREPLTWSSLNVLLIYGMLGWNREVWKRSYLDHQKEVLAYFEDSDRLLVLDVWTMDEEELWSALSKFLDRSVPDLPFPHIRKGSRWNMPDGNQMTMITGIPKISTL